MDELLLSASRTPAEVENSLYLNASLPPAISGAPDKVEKIALQILNYLKTERPKLIDVELAKKMPAGMPEQSGENADIPAMTPGDLLREYMRLKKKLGQTPSGTGGGLEV